MYAWSCVCVLCATELVSNPTREQLDKHLHNCPTYSYYNVQLGFDPSMRQKFSSMVIPTPTPRRKYLPPSTCAGVRYLDEYDLEFKYTDFENLANERGDK